MARNQNQQGGGGGGGSLFTRYGGMGMSPVPAGYLESASQEAAMYANIGQSIANSIYKQQEMALKEKEIETANTANTVAAEKNKQAERKNDITEAEKKDDVATKWLTARTAAAKEAFGLHDTAIQSIDARLSGLELKLSRNADPDDKNPKLTKVEANSILGEIEALKKKRAGHQSQLDEITTSLKSIPNTLFEYRVQERKAMEAQIKELTKPEETKPMNPWEQYVKPGLRAAGYFTGGMPAPISAPISLFNAYQSATSK